MRVSDTRKLEIVKVLLDQASIKGVRFSISKDFWLDKEFYDSLEERVFGTFRQWGIAAELKPYIDWDDGEVDTTITLHDMVPPALGLKLEPYADNRRAPQASRRRAAGEVPQPDPGQRRYVDVPYKQGGRNLQQRWFFETPEAIHVDERQGERQRPKINLDSSEYNSAYKMWVNVCLPMNWVKKMFGDTGFINQRLSDRSNEYNHKKTTVGEGIQFISYVLAIANNPAWPVRRMWQDKLSPGEKKVVPPPAIGRFGMTQNRFFHLFSLIDHQHSKSEQELDASDPWRFCNLPVDCHNAHWEEIYVPSWLLAPDESMCPETVEGDKPNQLPFLSKVPRKPKPLGCELWRRAPDPLAKGLVFD